MNSSFLSAAEAQKRVLAGVFDRRLAAFYGVQGDALAPYRQRIADAAAKFVSLYGDRPVRIFSVSGRTELGGNHTDHQHGRVLAGGISLDMIAVAAPDDEPVIRVQSEGYPEDAVALDDLAADPSAYGSSAALIRGTAARFAALGKPVGGFAAYTTSNVLKGSGMSSSAAFEVMIGTICNDFYADGAFSPAELAMIAQYAENEYFGKPCGLMDQMACALGGVCAIDFADPAKPVWRQVPLNLAKEGYALCIIDSGADHADLTGEYAAVVPEMRSVAQALGYEYLRDMPEAEFLAHLPELRKTCGDRAVLRAFHFYGDNARVVRQADALESGNFADYLRMVQESGQSSAAMLQNIYPAGSIREQAVAVTLAVCSKLLGGRGAYRVHGGGFAGTAQAYVPLDMAEAFRSHINMMLGAESCHVLQIRACGASALWDDTEGDQICC